jgi:riboflavin kinase/FMN adenylyltransferase
VEQFRRRRPQEDVISVLALGTFDGVHLGHQAILREALTLKERLSAQWDGFRMETVAFTFDALPLEVLRPEEAPARLMSTEQRCRHLLAVGVDRVVLARFDEAFSRLEPEDYVRDILLGAFRVGAIVAGYNHRFGRGGRGDISLLRRVAGDVAIHMVPEVKVDGAPVSSTVIRQLLAEGRCEQAASLLGRPYFLEGTVVTGFQQGRELGHPTANLQPHPQLLVPGQGVYLTRVRKDDGLLGYALTVISTRPTFDGRALSVESHILDFAGDLYGSFIQVEFLEYLRPIVRFDGVEALRRQIEADVEEARRRSAARTGADGSFT